jgi:hypothetical protein
MNFKKFLKPWVIASFLGLIALGILLPQTPKYLGSELFRHGRLKS